MEHTLQQSAAPFSLSWQHPQHYLTVQATARVADTTVDVHVHVPGLSSHPDIIELLQQTIDALQERIQALLEALEPGSHSLLTGYGSRSDYAPHIRAPKGMRAMEYTLHTHALQHAPHSLHSRYEYPQHTAHAESVQHIMQGLRAALDTWLTALAANHPPYHWPFKHAQQS